MAKNFHDASSTKKMLAHGRAQGMGAFRPKPKRVDIPAPAQMKTVTGDGFAADTLHDALLAAFATLHPDDQRTLYEATRAMNAKRKAVLGVTTSKDGKGGHETDQRTT